MQLNRSLLHPCIAALLLLNASQVQSTETPLYAGKQSEISIDLNAVGNDVNDGNLDGVRHATITPGGPYLKYRLPLDNEHAFDLALGDNHAYLAMASDGLLVIDIADGTAPTVVARLTIPHAAMRLTIVGKRLYIAGEQQLSIADISQPTAPKISGNYQTSSPIVALDALANGLTALLLANETLLALDTAAATKPQLLSTTLLAGPGHKLSMSNNRIYLAMGDAGVTVLNSRDPTAITTLHRYITSAAAVDLTQRDGILYVATTSAGVTLFDISTADRFIWVGSHQKVGNVQHVDVVGERVMALNDNDQFALLDAKMTDMPSIIATFQHPHQTQPQLTALAQHGSRLFAISHHELLEYDFATAPPQLSNEGLDFGQGVNFGGQRRGFIHANILYVADWFSGIHLYDISKPQHPRLLSSLKTAGSPKGVVVRDDYAYIADDDHGLLIVDVSDPNQPKTVATLPTPGLAYIPQLQDNLLYLASHHGGFQIIDISNASQPKLLSSTNTTGKAWGIQVRGNLTFIADGESGLLVFDSSDPTAPRQIGEFNPGGAAEDVVIDGDYAFVSFFDNGVFIVDISDPTMPTLLSHLSTPGNARGIAHKGEHLYVADWLAGLQIINISDPVQPRIVGSFDTEGAAWGVRLKDEQAYIFDWWGGLAVLDVSHPARPTLLARYLGNDKIQQVSAHDKFLFAASGSDGLQIFDINNPLNPTWFTGVNLDSAALGIAIDGDYAFVAQDNQYISIIDISNPFQSELLKQIKLDHRADIIRLGNHQLYVAERGTAITVIDIKQPLAPLIQTTYRVALSDLWSDGNTLYLTTAQQQLEIIDSRDPAELKRTHSFQLASQLSNMPLLLRGDDTRLYLYLPGDGILMVDISQPDKPQITAHIPLNMNLNDFQIEGSTLYVVAEGRYIFKYDISNPLQWQLRSRYYTSSQIDRFDIHNGLLYFAGSTNIIALQPLPAINLTVDATNQKISAVLPKAMPAGGYHLVVTDERNISTTLFNAINIKMKPLGKSSFTLSDLKKAMEKQKANGK